jgi:hypothetical protein
MEPWLGNEWKELFDEPILEKTEKKIEKVKSSI